MRDEAEKRINHLISQYNKVYNDTLSVVSDGRQQENKTIKEHNVYLYEQDSIRKKRVNKDGNSYEETKRIK